VFLRGVRSAHGVPGDGERSTLTIPFSFELSSFTLPLFIMTARINRVLLAALVVGAASTSSLALAQAAPNAPLYKVTDGYKVDAETMKGFRTWRAAACDRCHGANQEGMVGPSLIANLKTLSKEEFVKVVRDGRLDKGMQSFGTNKQVMDNMDQLYAYLKGRSDGAITRAKVEEIQ
jgi:mono/diheme cytochrome c family protein